MFASVLDFLNESPFMAGILCAFVIAASLFALTQILKHVKLTTKPPKRDFAQDHANMMILFQTMRDLLRSQKELARELNESIDKKIRVIKNVVAEAKEAKDELRVAQSELSELTNKARNDLDSLNVRVSSTAELEEKAPDQLPEPTTPEITKPEESSLLITPRPEREKADDIIDDWVGLDFGGDHPNAHVYDLPEEVPQAPSDPEAAREAFRTLLNMDNPSPQPAQVPKSQNQGSRKRSGNGRVKITPLQARVYEYSDAGMTTSQISRELGIGKGEIRLILGLRKDRGM